MTKLDVGGELPGTVYSVFSKDSDKPVL